MRELVIRTRSACPMPVHRRIRHFPPTPTRPSDYPPGWPFLPRVEITFEMGQGETTVWFALTPAEPDPSATADAEDDPFRRTLAPSAAMIDRLETMVDAVLRESASLGWRVLDRDALPLGAVAATLGRGESRRWLTALAISGEGSVMLRDHDPPGAFDA